jgi:nicotinate-nucleotide--dimethylbenzimidazole phosphoribosyltransferase
VNARTTIDDATAAIRPPDEDARAAARSLQARLTKPAGALGRLEDLHVWAAGVLRDAAPMLRRKLIVVAAADHGVVAEGVSAYPQDVTWQMVLNFLAGGAAINALAAQAGANVRVVDAGVARDLDAPALHVAKIRPGTANMAVGPAMSRDDAEVIVARGIAVALDECGRGVDAIGLGDMGIGNTTSAAAVTAVLADAPPRSTAGRGTGIADAALETKIDAIERAIAINRPDPLDGIDVLAKIGGFEIGFLAGVAIGAAAEGRIVVADGYPTTAAALIAVSIAPGCLDYLMASHESAEPGHRIALARQGLRPLLQLDMRLGEGTGAALAMMLLEAALRIPREMATFDGAGVSQSDDATQPEA